jgi:hypothetical protein
MGRGFWMWFCVGSYELGVEEGCCGAEGIPQRLKPHAMERFMARLKPRPFKTEIPYYLLEAGAVLTGFVDERVEESL